MSSIQIRPASAADQETINGMVREEGLDFTSLHWSHFLVAEDDGQIVGIGQVRPYPRCRELGSLAVQRNYRKQGVGALLVNALLARESGGVYLECLDYNERYYARFGFGRIPFWQAPWPLNFKSGLGSILGRFFGYRVITMRRPAA